MVETMVAALEVNVVFTTTRETLAALRKGAELARELGAEIRVIVPHVVPYPLPLEKPPVDQECCRRRLKALTVGESITTRVEVRLCRDWSDAILHRLAPEAVVLIGGASRRWWPGKSTRLARRLRKAGHHAIIVAPANDDRAFAATLRQWKQTMLGALAEPALAPREDRGLNHSFAKTFHLL